VEQCRDATTIANTERHEEPAAEPDEEHTDRLAAGTILGSYTVLDVIGEGGMGCVYLAEHTKLGRKVALKVLYWDYAAQREVVKRFFAEARAANQISHQNIVEINDFVEDESSGTYYLVMELLEGADLKEKMKREGILELDRCLRIAVQVADALVAAHAAGIIHRDLKPANVFLTERPGWEGDFVKLLDFGVAKLAEAARREVAGEITLEDTAPGIILGTPTYMSPEQASARPIDHRSDIYSFGIILYYMVTGSAPFKGEQVADLLVQHMTAPPPRPSRVEGLPHKVPRELERLILKCLAKSPENRPQSMEEVRDKLEEIARAPMRVPGGAGRRAAWVGGGAALVAGAIGVTWFLATSGGSPPPRELPTTTTADAAADEPGPAAQDAAIDQLSDGGSAVEGDAGSADAGSADADDVIVFEEAAAPPPPPRPRPRPPRGTHRQRPGHPPDLEGVLDPYED